MSDSFIDSRVIDESGDSIILDATETVSLDNSLVTAGTFGEGDGGDVVVKTRELHLLNGSQLATSTLGAGEGGNLTIFAHQEVVLQGADVPSALGAQTQSSGNAGEVNITTGSLQVLDGSQVTTITVGSGKGGKLTINATEEVIVKGDRADGCCSSALLTQTRSTGDAGDLSINTSTLTVLDGSQVTASSFSGSGKGGKLTVNANEILLNGISKNGLSPSGLYASAQGNATGAAGDIQIQAKQLTIQDGATISVSNSQGQAGNITIQAKTVSLDGGSLTALTGASAQEGANIRLEGLDLLLMHNGSLISAQATGDAKAA
jgi:large exoprotein involved in heme utilization and adhesion